MFLATSITAAALAFTAATAGGPASYTYQEITSAGEGGWSLTQEGIEHDHECVVHLSLAPYRAIVVSDTDPLCEAEAVQLTRDVGQVKQVPQGGIEVGDGSLAGAEDGASVDSEFWDDFDPSYDIDDNRNGVSDAFERATSGCTSDADCAAWERAHDLPQGGYTAGK